MRRGSVTLELSPDLSVWDSAMARAQEWASRLAGRFAWAYQGLSESDWRPVPHAFMPDFDLACTVSGCDLTPEQH